MEQCQKFRALNVQLKGLRAEVKLKILGTSVAIYPKVLLCFCNCMCHELYPSLSISYFILTIQIFLCREKIASDVFEFIDTLDEGNNLFLG